MGIINRGPTTREETINKWKDMNMILTIHVDGCQRCVCGIFKKTIYYRIIIEDFKQTDSRVMSRVASNFVMCSKRYYASLIFRSSASKRIIIVFCMLG